MKEETTSNESPSNVTGESFDLHLGIALDRAIRIGSENAAPNSFDLDFSSVALQMFVYALREQDGKYLSEFVRFRLADMLQEIVDGTDARDATYSHTGHGNPRWKRRNRNIQIVVRMIQLVHGRKMKPWPAAGKVAETKKFTDEKGNPLTQKTINNIWLASQKDKELFPGLETFRRFVPNLKLPG